MYVNVCVDIPAAQVNKLFTYKVPKIYEKIIQIGMRVIVPFGRRKLLAIVCELYPENEFDGDIKELFTLMDYESFLSEELIILSDYLYQNLQSFRINILKAMLPSMLKVKYETRFYIQKASEFREYIQDKKVAYNLKNDYIPKNQLEEIFTPELIKKLMDQHIVSVEYTVIDQQTTKMISHISTNMTIEAYQTLMEELPARNHKQRQLLTYVISHYPMNSVKKSEIIAGGGLTHHDIKNAIEKEWLIEDRIPTYRNPLEQMLNQPNDKRSLTHEQLIAFQKMSEIIDHKQSKTILLEGVTGSGKTEVYLQLIEKVIQRGETAILLVPEISLTPQMIRLVVGRFHEGVAVLHSGLSTAEKYDEWRRIIRGEVKIVVGARSSIFAPLENLGIIIIDEEHETSYKQSETPKYHARDIADWRGQFHSCPVILGSATPSLETKARASKGVYEYVALRSRANQKPLPRVDIVDMTLLDVQTRQREISPQLYNKINEKLHANQQVILLLNRRGYASYMLCRDCGFVLECPNCDVSLTYHKYEHRMKCHYCDYHAAVPIKCPTCQSPNMRQHGIGTQKITETLEELLPNARILRMDNDTTKRKGSHQKILDAFRNHEADILVGTQMIAKGLDFENVTLVGVINADTSLFISDFRASERTFQLLTQVSGRAGRGNLAGEVIIQTYNPDHYALQYAQKHDYQQFFMHEMKYRHMANYPPYYFMTIIETTGKNETIVHELIYQIKEDFTKFSHSTENLCMILGPSKSGIGRINNRYHYQLILKYKDKERIKTFIQKIVNKYQDYSKKGVYINIDHEPLYNV